MRNLIDLYNIVINTLIEYKKRKRIPHNGLCILPTLLLRDRIISVQENYLLEKDLDTRLSYLSNIQGYCNYKWIPMSCVDGQIQERIDFIQSIINELENG